MITIGAVNWHSEDWMELMIRSIKAFTTVEHEILIWDNSNNLGPNDDAVIYCSNENVGHGRGIENLVTRAKGKYFLALDIDAHILRKGWDTELIEWYESDEKIKLIAGEGGILKPFRPHVSFFEPGFFTSYGCPFSPVPVPLPKGHYTIDAGVMLGLKLLNDGYKAERLPYLKTSYVDTWGHEHSLNGKRTFYHNWYGTRFHGCPTVDGKKEADMLEAKANLFGQVNF